MIEFEEMSEGWAQKAVEITNDGEKNTMLQGLKTILN